MFSTLFFTIFFCPYKEALVSGKEEWMNQKMNKVSAEWSEGSSYVPYLEASDKGSTTGVCPGTRFVLHPYP